MLSRRRFVAGSGGGALIGAGVFQGARAAKGVADDTILLGQSVALTGPFGELGSDYRAGAKLWFDHLNSKGGIYGRQIRLLSVDDGYDVDKAVENTRRLIEKDNVFAIFGQFGTSATRASFSSTVHQGVPVFAPYTGADALREYGNRYLFHVRASYGQELRHMADQLAATGVSRIAIVYQDDGFGQAALHGTIAGLQRHKFVPTVTAAMPISPEINVGPAVAAVSEKRPAAIIICTAGKGAVAFARKYREADASSQLYAISEASSRELGAASRGIVITQVVPSPWNQLVPVSLEYQRLRSKQQDLAAGYGSLEGFVAAKVFSEGLKRAGQRLTRETLVDSLESISDLDIGGFRVTYGAGNHAGSTYVDISMLKSNGEFLR